MHSSDGRLSLHAAATAGFVAGVSATNTGVAESAEGSISQNSSDFDSETSSSALFLPVQTEHD